MDGRSLSFIYMTREKLSFYHGLPKDVYLELHSSSHITAVVSYCAHFVNAAFTNQIAWLSRLINTTYKTGGNTHLFAHLRLTLYLTLLIR